MGNCLHGAKHSARKAEESVGLKGTSKSAHYDKTIVEDKKSIEKAVKTLEKIVKLVESSGKEWSATTKASSNYGKVAEKIPEEMKDEQIIPTTQSTLLDLESKVVNDTDREDIMKGLEFVKNYIREAKKSTGLEFTEYDKARVEYDLYTDKLAKTTDEVKKAGTEMKLQMAQQEFDLKHDRLRGRLDNLLKALPTVFESAGTTLVASHGNYYKKYSATLAAMEPMVEQNKDKLAITVESLKADAEAAVNAAKPPAAEAVDAMEPDAPMEEVAAPPAPAAPMEPVAEVAEAVAS
mmetsp:Transcript_26191/g.102596  ORF Transcript_26191/g.102596 Transcript_26191/m.102596 type:complete len:293 (-) Transcript_26191:287-1165(-)|eukprot:CAMPEP_0113955888 /NCGR_PEP_ID=MMETSP0011_2-20120614/1690_1 /TAXON_ID=101924 /ORGANISM="Rhodosorus marinus" /LENGTH=292 /DNA_ID=CAMNT_0000965841 /DNA_START=109 /DNA_END=987 /DNA_ORIENTATION=- /assembly_acc=CAM_ASM_000156